MELWAGAESEETVCEEILCDDSELQSLLGVLGNALNFWLFKSRVVMGTGADSNTCGQERAFDVVLEDGVCRSLPRMLINGGVRSNKRILSSGRKDRGGCPTARSGQALD
jgi:hypothetical protein